MRLTEKAHQILREHLRTGDLAIDATAGNGYDTSFLAEQVGEHGRVIAIDLQASAIESTKAKLRAANLMERVHLHCADHAGALESLKEQHSGTVDAILFNLGYLPGSDKTIQTHTESTVRALKASAKQLRPGGLLCVTAYRGHLGGAEEAQCVEDWMHSQEPHGYTLECYEPSSTNTPPILWVLRKPRLDEH
jgi:predicted methyltransferase